MAKGSNNIRGRSSDASKPYDVSNSFVKRMASRVTELLPQPTSWLSRWISPASAPSTNDFVGQSLSSTTTSRPPATSRADLNLVDNVDHHAPAAKKPRINRYSSPVNQNKFLRSEGYNAEDISPIALRGGEPVAGPSNAHPELIASTPAVSVPQASAKVNGGSRFGRSLAAGTTLDALDRRRPSFSATTFHSPLRASMRNRLGSSPFYSGRTMYGGSSQAYEYSRMIADQSPQRRVGPTMKPPPSQQQAMPLSSTAKRILDALEQFSTPLIDAKRMPVVGSKRKLETVSSGLKRYTELSIPSTPDLLRVKRRERLQQSTLDARQASQSATFPSPPTPAEYNIRKEETDKKKHTGKVKTKEKLDEETVAEVNLPSVTLTVENLPKIDIAIPPPPPSLTTSNLPPKSSMVSKFVFSPPTIVTSVITPVSTPTSKFKFSVPLGDTISDSSAMSDTKKSTVSSSVTTLSRTSSETVSSFLKRKANGDEDKDINIDKKNLNESNEESSSNLKSGVSESSDMLPDSKSRNERPRTDGKTVSMSNQWECPKCKNNNASNSEVCMSCQTNKISKSFDTSKNNIKPSVSVGFGDLYKKPVGTWECSVCMIQNKTEATKCIACESPKPPPKEKLPLETSKSDITKIKDVEKSKADTKAAGFNKLEAPSEVKQSDGGFGNLFKKPAGSWTCDICMITNNPDKLKCAACETPKPGVTLPKTTESAAPKFSFGIPPAISTGSSGTGATFSFGIPKGDQSGSVSSSTLTVPKSSSGLETSSVSAPTFSFGISATQKTESEATGIAASSTTLKSGFQFATSSTKISSPDSKTNFMTSSAAGNIFGNLAKSSTTETSKASVSEKATFNIPASTSLTVTSNTGITTSNSIFSTANEKPSSTEKGSSSDKPMFTFGSNKVTLNENEKPSNDNSTTKLAQPSFMFGTKQGGFGSSIPSSTTNTLSSSSSSNIFKFGDTKTVSSGGETLSISSVSTQPSIISPKPNNLFSFGSNSEKKDITFTETPVKETPSTTANTPSVENKSTFGSFAAPTNPPAAFGNTNTFGNNAFSSKEQQPNPFISQTPSVFGATTSSTSTSSTFSGFGQTSTFQTPAQENKPSPVFAFGATAQKEPAPSGGFVFNAPSFQTTQSQQTTSGPLFGFNTTATTAPASTFNFEPKPFGTTGPGISPFNSTTNNPTPVFGTQAPQPPAFGEQSAQTPAPMFSFGSQPAQQSQTQTNPVFEFGSNQQQGAPVAPSQPPGTTFMFGANPVAPANNPPAFDPNIKPTFNFTQGSTPVFSAVPTANPTGSVQAPVRKIRKAVRRTNISSVRQT